MTFLVRTLVECAAIFVGLYFLWALAATATR